MAERFAKLLESIARESKEGGAANSPLRFWRYAVTSPLRLRFAYCTTYFLICAPVASRDSSVATQTPVTSALCLLIVDGPLIPTAGARSPSNLASQSLSFIADRWIDPMFDAFLFSANARRVKGRRNRKIQIEKYIFEIPNWC